jgi:hypothetical protein
MSVCVYRKIDNCLYQLRFNCQYTIKQRKFTRKFIFVSWKMQVPNVVGLCNVITKLSLSLSSKGHSPMQICFLF